MFCLGEGDDLGSWGEGARLKMGCWKSKGRLVVLELGVKKFLKL